jgi:hypothetical protein
MGYRMQLGSEKHNTDYWFDYGKKSLFTDNYKKIANEIIELWSNAEKWWEENTSEQTGLK